MGRWQNMINFVNETKFRNSYFFQYLYYAEVNDTFFNIIFFCYYGNKAS